MENMAEKQALGSRIRAERSRRSITRANTEYEMGYYDLAIADLEQLIEINPENPDIYILKGNIYSKKGLCDEALNEFERAISLGVNREMLKWNMEECKKNKEK